MRGRRGEDAYYFVLKNLSFSTTLFLQKRRKRPASRSPQSSFITLCLFTIIVLLLDIVEQQFPSL